MLHLLLFFGFMGLGCLMAEDLDQTLNRSEYVDECIEFESQEGLEEADCHAYRQSHLFTFNPEISALNRARSGGTKQHGTIYGLRAEYDYIRRYRFSVGLLGSISQGTLNGRTSEGAANRSHWKDQLFEIYLGYTFQAKGSSKLSFTPFGGYGNFCETNKFVSPSLLHLKFTTKCPYVVYGFLSSVKICQRVKLGFNVRIRNLIDPKCRVTDDPDGNPITQQIGDSFQYRLELPVQYQIAFLRDSFEIGLMPFYEKREYLGRISFPFAYPKTNIKMFGISLQCVFKF